MLVHRVLILFLSCLQIASPQVPGWLTHAVCPMYLQLELSLLDATGPAKGKGLSIDQPEMMQSAQEQHNMIIRDQAQEIRSLKCQLDSCEEQFKGLEADSQQRLMEKDEIIKSLREGMAIKSELFDRLKTDHARELAARDEKYNSLFKAFEGFGSIVRSSVLQLAGLSFIPFNHVCCKQPL